MKKIVIVGAGILGASLAYELSKKNLNINIIEADFEGAATTAGAGIICPWTTKRKNKLWYQLAENGAKYYPSLIQSLESDNELDHGYSKVGALSLNATHEEIRLLKDKLTHLRKKAPEIGDLQELDIEETTKLCSFADYRYYSLFIEGAAQVDGNKLKKSLLNAAIKNGAKLIRGQATLHQSFTEKPVLEINKNPLSYETLIVTNGAWMKDFFSELQINLRTDFQKGQVIHLKKENINTSQLPIIMTPNSQYILGFPNQKLVVGPTREPIKEMDTSVTAHGVFNILNKLNEFAPLLLDAEISKVKTGFRPNTFNRLPVFGPLPKHSNIFLANGLGASGLTTGPYIAKLLSQIILNELTDIPIEPYHVDQLIKQS